ncbi:HAD family hydrolase [Ferrimonas lipolytica]|uniref:Haloacid dehalogenase-like hydrolase n=1 Tax=Ferrimonas lipolytica TaxID=2724191 RepID=A0A6H1UCW5_9GAMM|nr:HAD family hydrolase [Ferrimonas lipolytica]QIZ76911.1 haloacid dehalogenase-like hydrolase [Ferrimonas lipolytica]
MMSLSEEAEAKLKQKKLKQMRRQQLQIERAATTDKVIESVNGSDDDTLLFIDFDETLWLRNSTEMFLASIKPSLVVSLLLQWMILLRPWLWFGSHRSEEGRERFRVKLVLRLIPSAKARWLEHAKVLGPQFANRALITALQTKPSGNVHIVTYGFDFIVQPLLDAIAPEFQLTLASNFDNAVAMRQRGKAELLQQQFGDATLQHSICITDSTDDIDLLELSQRGLFCHWPDARFEEAGLTPMLPFVFTKKVNRPKEKYFTRVIIGHDYVGLLLAFALVSEQPLLTLVSLFLFVLAFFTIYETGYFENDRLGLVLEQNPRVSEEFLRFNHHFKPWFAWLCGVLLAAPASLIASNSSSWIPSYFNVSGLAAFALIWLAFMLFMLFVRATFYWFNRTPVKGRLIPMLVLQFCRNCGYLVVFSTSVTGALFCLSWTLGKWFPYIIYRFGGSAMGYPNHLVTVLIMLSMMLVVGLSHQQGFGIFADWPSVVMLAYALVRGGKDLWSFRSSLKPLRPVEQRTS